MCIRDRDEDDFDSDSSEDLREEYRRHLADTRHGHKSYYDLSLIHISEPTRPERISYAVFCLKKKNIKLLTKAFQRRFRQDLVNGIIDEECLLISKNLTKNLE